jgi:hypothetical protein
VYVGARKDNASLHTIVNVLAQSAAQSASEDFAETYAFYLGRPGVLERDLPEKHAFMRDCVFSGVPDTLKERVQGDSGRGSSV